MRRRVRVNQMVLDHLAKPINTARVLDLGSLNGHFAAEFACRGATVVGLEGRATNVVHAKELFPLPNLTFVQDDVRNLSRAKYGTFDVVLCLGLLYHLDAPACFQVLEAIADVCTGVAVIDTHIALTRDVRVQYKRRDYFGWRYQEYAKRPTADEQEQANWSSIGNLASFWPTKSSLVNAIRDGGFTSVYECHYPAWNDIPADRVALVALKNQSATILAVPDEPAIYGERLDETPKTPAIQSHSSGPRPSRLARVWDHARAAIITAWSG
jgi:SAM-dependent methyltransferase